MGRGRIRPTFLDHHEPLAVRSDIELCTSCGAYLEVSLSATDDIENPVLNAINAVRAMNTALINFNEYLDLMYDRSFAIRAGINFGKTIIGNFDTGKMKKIAAIGDVVNMASRIESANKEFGTQLLISQSAHKEIQELVETDKTYRSKLKGKTGEYVLYEVKI